jgi:hypothetical protein
MSQTDVNSFSLMVEVDEIKTTFWCLLSPTVGEMDTPSISGIHITTQARAALTPVT